MALKVARIDQLHPSVTTAAIAVRVVRVYEVPFNGNANDPMSLECVLHDCQGVRIHASLGKAVLKSLAVKIKEGNCYVFHKFYTRANHMRYKTTAHPYRIIFTQKTEISEFRDADFATEMFSFKRFTEIAKIENIVDVPMFDVIGVIVGSPGVVNQSNAKLLELEIEDEKHNTVMCTLWENYVDEFLNQVDPLVKQIPIIVVQFCRPTLYKGEVRISTSYNVSKVTLNGDSKEVRDMRERIFGDQKFLESMDLTFSTEPKNLADEMDNLDVKTIEDLFCLEDGCYWICAKIDHIECNGDWWYMACKRCTKKVTAVEGGGFHCDRCLKDDCLAVKRFILKINVVDATSNATLTLWDRECVQLLGKRPWEVDAVGSKGTTQSMIPSEIEEGLIDRFVLFKVQMRVDAEFKFDQAYNVVKICSSPTIVDRHAAAVTSSQQESWNQSLSDISFGCDIAKISTDSQSTYGAEFEGIFQKGKEIIESVKRELDEEFSACVSGKKVKVEVLE